MSDQETPPDAEGAESSETPPGILIGFPKETAPGEQRAAVSPTSVEKLIKLGYRVAVETGTGVGARFGDDVYVEAGATIAPDAKTIWTDSDLVMKVNKPSLDEVALLREGGQLISFIQPGQNEELVKALAERKATVFAMDCVPRISRAQKMDALSSMANIAGYRAVIEAANQFGRFFTAQMTAAGSLPPAKVLVIGAGVAGLAAIAAARGLGAIVRAFDTREAVKDQVKSLGAEFLEVDFEESGEGEGGYAKVMSKAFIEAEMQMFRDQAPEIDIVITTALIPGRKAPILWEKSAVELMKPGSVVVDLAASAGGNCEVTEPEKVIEHEGVTVIGYTDLTSRLATTATQLYAQNLVHLLKDMTSEDKGGFFIDLEDEVVRGSIVLKEGEMLWPAPKPEPKPAAAKPKPAPQPEKAKEPEKAPKEKPSTGKTVEEPKGAGMVWAIVGLLLAGAWLWARLAKGDAAAEPETVKLLQHLTVFVLAVFVGWQVIWNVTAALHTPLMSVTNAISGIIIVGGILQGTSTDMSSAHVLLGVLAVLVATINIAGGFLVTQRMLKMFRKG